MAPQVFVGNTERVINQFPLDCLSLSEGLGNNLLRHGSENSSCLDGDHGDVNEVVEYYPSCFCVLEEVILRAKVICIALC